MRGDILQYLSDTVLIEKMSEPNPFEKKAGLFNELGFDGLAATIKNAFKGKGLTDVLVLGTLFKIHPILILVNFVAKRFLGFSAEDVVKSIIGKLKSTLKGGGQVTAAEVNAAGKDVIGGLGDAMGATASDNMLEHLYKLDDSGFFKKEAKIRTPSNIEFFGSRAGTRWKSVFGDLLPGHRRGKLTWLIGGIIIWSLKTALLGAGLLVGSQLIGRLIGGKPKETKVEEVSKVGPTATEIADRAVKQAPVVTTKEAPPVPALIRDPFPKSGWGEEEFPNDADNAWMVSLKNRNVRETLIEWAGLVYPALKGKRYMITSAVSFRKTLSQMSRSFDPNSDSLIVPGQLFGKNVNTIKEIVDLFSKEVSRKMKG